MHLGLRKGGRASCAAAIWQSANQLLIEPAYNLSNVAAKELTLYSSRHSFKGFIDDLKSLSERSRRIVMGHATVIDTSGGCGPKSITEEQAEVVLNLSNSTIERMATLLLGPKERADRGELKTIGAWRNDERSSDEKLQIVLAKRAELYR